MSFTDGATSSSDCAPFIYRLFPSVHRTLVHNLALRRLLVMRVRLDDGVLGSLLLLSSQSFSQLSSGPRNLLAISTVVAPQPMHLDAMAMDFVLLSETVALMEDRYDQRRENRYHTLRTHLALTSGLVLSLRNSLTLLDAAANRTLVAWEALKDECLPERIVSERCGVDAIRFREAAINNVQSSIRQVDRASEVFCAVIERTVAVARGYLLQCTEPLLHTIEYSLRKSSPRNRKPLIAENLKKIYRSNNIVVPATNGHKRSLSMCSDASAISVSAANLLQVSGKTSKKTIRSKSMSMRQRLPPITQTGLVTHLNAYLLQLSAQLPPAQKDSLLWTFDNLDRDLLSHTAHSTCYDHLYLFIENVVHYWAHTGATVQLRVAFHANADIAANQEDSKDVMKTSSPRRIGEVTNQSPRMRTTTLYQDNLQSLRWEPISANVGNNAPSRRVSEAANSPQSFRTAALVSPLSSKGSPAHAERKQTSNRTLARSLRSPPAPNSLRVGASSIRMGDACTSNRGAPVASHPAGSNSPGTHKCAGHLTFHLSFSDVPHENASQLTFPREVAQHLLALLQVSVQNIHPEATACAIDHTMSYFTSARPVMSSSKKRSSQTPTASLKSIKPLTGVSRMSDFLSLSSFSLDISDDDIDDKNDEVDDRVAAYLLKVPCTLYRKETVSNTADPVIVSSLFHQEKKRELQMLRQSSKRSPRGDMSKKTNGYFDWGHRALSWFHGGLPSDTSVISSKEYSLFSRVSEPSMTFRPAVNSSPFSSRGATLERAILEKRKNSDVPTTASFLSIGEMWTRPAETTRKRRPAMDTPTTFSFLPKWLGGKR